MLKKWIILLSIVSLLLACSSCNGEKASEEADLSEAPKAEISLDEDLPIASEGDVLYFSNSLDRLKAYSTFEELSSDSANILSGLCISSTPVFQNNVLYTLSEIQISEVYKGDVSVGDTITIVEMGGRTTYAEYVKGSNLTEKSFSQGDEQIQDDQEIVIGDDGYFPLNTGEQVLLFTNEAEYFLKDIEEATYSILGTYDGKLYLQEDGTYRKAASSQTDALAFDDSCLTITVEQLTDSTD